MLIAFPIPNNCMEALRVIKGLSQPGERAEFASNLHAFPFKEDLSIDTSLFQSNPASWTIPLMTLLWPVCGWLHFDLLLTSLWQMLTSLWPVDDLSMTFYSPCILQEVRERVCRTLQYLEPHNVKTDISEVVQASLPSCFLNGWKAGLSIIYLSRVLCLCVCVCVSQFVSERSAILLVLAIKLTKETRRKAWRGRD